MSYDPFAYEPEVVLVLKRCLRCGAVVADPERHDAWHGAMDR